MHITGRRRRRVTFAVVNSFLEPFAADSVLVACVAYVSFPYEKKRGEKISHKSSSERRRLQRADEPTSPGWEVAPERVLTPLRLATAQICARSFHWWRGASLASPHTAHHPFSLGECFQLRGKEGGAKHNLLQSWPAEPGGLVTWTADRSSIPPPLLRPAFCDPRTHTEVDCRHSAGRCVRASVCSPSSSQPAPPPVNKPCQWARWAAGETRTGAVWITQQHAEATVSPSAGGASQRNGGGWVGREGGEGGGSATSAVAAPDWQHNSVGRWGEIDRR